MNLPSFRPRHTVIPADAVRSNAGVLAVFSGVVRRGTWELARHLRVLTVCGSSEIDLREAVLAEGDSVIEVFCLFGSVEIVAPSGVQVIVDGDTLAAEFSDTPDPSVAPEPNGPRVIVRGTAWFGSVECESRLAGESSSQAKKRIRKARRETPG